MVANDAVESGRTLSADEILFDLCAFIELIIFSLYHILFSLKILERKIQ